MADLCFSWDSFNRILRSVNLAFNFASVSCCFRWSGNRPSNRSRYRCTKQTCFCKVAISSGARRSKVAKEDSWKEQEIPDWKPARFCFNSFSCFSNKSQLQWADAKSIQQNYLGVAIGDAVVTLPFERFASPTMLSLALPKNQNSIHQTEYGIHWKQYTKHAHLHNKFIHTKSTNVSETNSHPLFPPFLPPPKKKKNKKT